MQESLKQKVSVEDTFGLTPEYVKKIRDTLKEKDVYDEEFQQDSFGSLKKKLIELDAKLKKVPRTVGRSDPQNRFPTRKLSCSSRPPGSR